MLEDFAAVKVDAKKPEVSVAAPELAAASVTEAEGPAVSEDDFAKQLQAGMADLLGELDNSVGGRVLPRQMRASNLPQAGDAGAV